MTYQFIDSGEGKKFEQFGEFSLIRPCPAATWSKKKPELWFDAHSEFTDVWTGELPESWVIEIEGILFKLALRSGGQIGIFPEHAALWKNLKCKKALNLFAYTGGASIALARSGDVTHVDASKASVDWAKENAALNGVSNIRWIVEDAMTFLRREIKRDNTYDTILLDPPTFGRGPKGEVFKIEKDLVPMLELCKNLDPSLLLLSCHTSGICVDGLAKLAAKVFSGKLEKGELLHSSVYVKIHVKNH